MALKFATVNYILPNWEKDTAKDSKEVIRMSVKDPKNQEQRFLLFHVNLTTFSPEEIEEMNTILKTFSMW